MTTAPFFTGTMELLNDTAIAAFNDAREGGLPDHRGKAEFLTAAGLAWDHAADTATDRPEFLG